MNVERCARCRRPAPEWNGPASIAWELERDDAGVAVAIVCPDCLTETEQRLRAEDAADLAARLARRVD